MGEYYIPSSLHSNQHIIMCSINDRCWLMFPVVFNFGNFLLEKKYTKSSEGDIYTNNLKEKNMIEEKYFSKIIFAMLVPKSVKQMILY